MKLNPPENANYAAVVVRIKVLNPLPKLDNVVGTPLLGFQAIVGKDTAIGTLGIVFPAETQLSDEFARLNNLHRHGNLNADQAAKGYLEDNRRVKAIKFMGNRSDALFMPLESLDYIQGDIFDGLREGDVFDTLNGHAICSKYVVKRGVPNNGQSKSARRQFDERFFPRHAETDNYFRNADKIPNDVHVFVTQKLHGTSVRIGMVPVNRDLSLVERVLVRFGVKIQDTQYAFVVGSRNVVKSVDGE